ncbi:MAG: cytochrome P450 [Actinomycetota bacterium]
MTAVNVWEERLQRAAHPKGYPLLKWLAKLGTNIRIPGVGLVVSEAQLMRDVLTDPVFTKTGKGGPAGLWTPITGPTALVNMDGDAHLSLRRKLGPIFSPRAMGELSAAIMDEPLGQMLDRLKNGESIDVVAEVSRIAGTMICELTGLDISDTSVADVVLQAHELTSQASLTGTLTEEQAVYSRGVLAKLTHPVIAAYHRGEENTVPGRMKALGLSEEEAVGAATAFIIAGTETIISYLPRMVALILESGWLHKLSDDPEAMGRVINEGLRLTVPTPVMLRAVEEDSVIGGKKIKAGQRAVLLTLFACRRVPQGGTFDPDREIPKPMQQMWFGAGSHFCIGMPLAMSQTKGFIYTLLEAVKDGSDIVIEDRAVRKNVLAPSYEKLIVRKINAA